MKLPTFIADRSIRTGAALAAGAQTVSASAGIGAMIDIWCIAKCAGSSALKCIPKCGTDLKCWATCAGPDVITCVAGCF